MGLFSGIKDAKATQGGNYLKPGMYLVQVLRVNIGKTRKGVDFFAVDMKVLGSNSDEHGLGSVVNWFVGFDKDASLGNCKAFACAVLSNALPEGQDFDESTITEEVMEGLVADNGKAIQGQKLRVQVTLVPTKTGGQFSRHLWFREKSAEAAAAA